MTSVKDPYKSLAADEWKASSMERHDLFNFESKIDYVLVRSPDTKKNSYLLETFFFIPENLQINKDSYSRDQFFLDLNNRIRFKTPQMSIEGILDNKNPLSPVNIIVERIKEIEYGKKDEHTEIRLEREIRLLACMIKVSLRDQFSYILKNYGNLRKQCDIDSILCNYLGGIENLEVKMTWLREKFILAQMPYKLREAFQFADEYISLQIKTWIAQSLDKLEQRIDPKVRSKMIKIIQHEQDFRRSINSRLILKDNDENEDFTYYESILKKYVQGVLYLEKKKKDPKSSSIQVFYSVAAGFAMFLSLFLGFIFLLSFEVNSIPFILGTVVIYMLKDRIKDNIRNISNKAVGLFFPDKRVEILDQYYQKKIGESKEKVIFLKQEDIPQEILQIRSSSNKSTLEEEGKPEVVLSYKQKIDLLNEEIDKIHIRKKDISNIIRFNIQEFIRYADDPIQYDHLWDEGKRKVEIIPVSKVYHLNIILKLTSFKGKEIKRTYFKKFRVVLDQKGIKRIEEPEVTL